MTPLHLASQNNHIEIARLLIAAGAKLDLKDIDGKVPTYVTASTYIRIIMYVMMYVIAQLY